MDNSTSATGRIIALIDMDCFYCQVEARCDPTIKGKPIAIVQNDHWKQSRFIAVSYEARDRGVTRFMKGYDAIKLCPDLVVVRSPNIRGRTDLTKYRDAGAEVASVFCSFSDCVQRASVDEAFLDLTTLVDDRIRNGAVNLTPESLRSTFVIGYSDLKSNDSALREKGTTKWLRSVQESATSSNPEYRLAVGAQIVEEIRAEVERKTQFHCSAGIAHNKILAKLVAGIHKPKCQTVLPQENVPELYESIPVHKVRNLGGKFGQAVAEKFSIAMMSELYQFSKKQLQAAFDDKNGSWLYDIARGIDHDPVTPRLKSESIGCCKNFLGKSALKTVDAVKHWLLEMSGDVADRLGKDFAENKRKAKLLTITFRQDDTLSRSCPLTSYQTNGIFENAFDVLKKFNQSSVESGAWEPPIQHMGLSVSKFSSEQTSTITNFFKSGEKPICLPKKVKRTHESDEFPSAIDGGGPASESESPIVEAIDSKSDIRNFFTSGVQNDSGKTSDSTSLKNNSVASMEIAAVVPSGSETINRTISSSSSFFKKFFTDPPLENTPATSSASDSGNHVEQGEVPNEGISSAPCMVSETCAECKKVIPLADFLEHLDYHEAVKLSKVINGKLPVKTVTVRNSPQKVHSPDKKKRKTVKPQNQHSIKTFLNPITSEHK